MSRLNRSIRREAGLRAIGVAAIVALLPGAGSLADDASGKVPLAAPVKVLEAQPASPQPVGLVLPQAQRPQPTLPSGKLPQYQLGDDLGASDEPQNPKLRFLLALPSRPILIEAAITIDGRPFRMARESRIAEIIKAATASAEDSGTSAEVAAEPADAAAPETENAEDAEKSELAQPSTRRYSLPSAPAEFVRRYLEATGREPSPAEVRWLLAERIDGPVLLILNDNFQRFRANQRPVFHVLDRDRDGAISPDELEQAVKSFQECDLNRDGIVDATEIAKAAADPRLKNFEPTAAGKLIDRAADATAAPDLTLAVSFNTADPAQSTIAVTAWGGELQVAAAAAEVNGETISIPRSDAILAFSAVQYGAGDQISLGAVNDGYPLLPVLDPNDDGRFTVRELRELVPRLRQFDRNQDGGLTADEIPPTIRICFGLGPFVHRELAGIRSVNRPSGAPAVQAPAWFARMDRNKDNDLTRAEFPGTDEQFQELDADQDGLISGQEAAEFERKLQAPE
jgi:Ca2+-binding EF-hand superfamily protein